MAEMLSWRPKGGPKTGLGREGCLAPRCWRARRPPQSGEEHYDDGTKNGRIVLRVPVEPGRIIAGCIKQSSLRQCVHWIDHYVPNSFAPSSMVGRVVRKATGKRPSCPNKQAQGDRHPSYYKHRPHRESEEAAINSSASGTSGLANTHIK